MRAELGRPDDVFFEGVMDALEYKANRRPFRRLMRRLPVGELRRFVPPDLAEAGRALLLESILFGVAGLLPDEDQGWDEETREYTTHLHLS